MTNFTREELKVAKSIIRIELEDEQRTLDSLSYTPYSAAAIKRIENRIVVLKSILEKISG